MSDITYVLSHTIGLDYNRATLQIGEGMVEVKRGGRKIDSISCEDINR